MFALAGDGVAATLFKSLLGPDLGCIRLLVLHLGSEAQPTVAAPGPARAGVHLHVGPQRRAAISPAVTSFF
jgi:hypothetical protein